MSRRPNLTERQLKDLMRQGATNSQAAKKAERVIYEADIEKDFDKAMEHDGWRVLKQEENFSERKKKKTGERGMTDKLYLRYWNSGDPRGPVPGYKTRCYNPQGEILWIEWKRDRRRRKDQAHQKTWQDRERSRGALVWVAGEDFDPSVAGAALHYLESGLARRREVFLALIPPEGRPKA